jgi:flagellar protein FlgJ
VNPSSFYLLQGKEKATFLFKEAYLKKILNNLKPSKKNILSLSQKNKKDLSNVSRKKEKLMEVAHEFEAIFIKQLLNVLRRSIPKNGLFYGGFGEEIFTDMLYNEYAKLMSKNFKFGLATKIYEQMSRHLQ